MHHNSPSQFLTALVLGVARRADASVSVFEVDNGKVFLLKSSLPAKGIVHIDTAIVIVTTDDQSDLAFFVNIGMMHSLARQFQWLTE